MGLFSGIFGGGNKSAPQFTPVLPKKYKDLQTAQRAENAADEFLNFAKTSPTEVSRAGKLQQRLLEERKKQSMSDLAKSGQSRYATLNQQLQLTGQGAGAAERLARQQDIQSGRDALDTIGRYDTMAKEIAASDIGTQQQLRNQMRMSSPDVAMAPLQIEAGLDANRTKLINAANAANLNSLAMFNQQRAARNGLFAGLAGGVAGYGLSGGNPIGFMVGSQLGRNMV